MARKVTVDDEACIACGNCWTTCPEVFEEGEDGKSQVKKNADLNIPCVQKAEVECPAEAIKVED